MNFLKPATWFKTDPESSGFVWAKVNPIRPHISISFLSEEADPPWPCGFKVTGVSIVEAEHVPLLGRVIDWDQFSAKEQAEIKSRSFTIGFKKLMKLVRR